MATLELRQYSILLRGFLGSIVSVGVFPRELPGWRCEAATILFIVVFSPLKRFYAGFYCWKTSDSDRRRRASSCARRAGTLPRNFRSQQSADLRGCSSIRFRQ